MTCVFLWVTTACNANHADDGDGGDGGPADDGDGVDDPPPVLPPVDDPPVNDGPPATITVTTTTTPALIAFRDGTEAAWRTPAAAAPGRYDVVVHGPYTVAVACSTADHIEITEIARTPDDPREITVPCQPPTATPPRLHVTGTMTQPAQLALGLAQSVTTGDELQFDLAVDPGTFDLVVKTVAAPGQDEVVIRRDQVITGSTTLTPSIDPAREKVALVEVPVTVTNVLSDDSTVVAARLSTSTTAGPLATGRTPNSVRVLADSVLRPTDVQSVRALASLVETDGPYFVRFRTVDQRLGPGPALVLALPATLDSLAFAVVDDQLRATWSALPDHDTLELAISVKPRILHRKLLSAGYVTATRATSATLDTRMPGFSPAWKIDLAGPYQRKFVAQRTQTDGTGSISLLDEDANMAPGTGRAEQPALR